jgi:NTP pyrophosphatase (non-canonical NTP hydrolase)
MDIKKLTADSKIISQNYTKKFGIRRTDDWYLLKIQEELGEVTKSYLRKHGQKITNGKDAAQLQQELDDELADLLCHVLLFAHAQGVDIEKAVEKKWLHWLPKNKKA